MLLFPLAVCLVGPVVSGSSSTLNQPEQIRAPLWSQVFQLCNWSHPFCGFGTHFWRMEQTGSMWKAQGVGSLLVPLSSSPQPPPVCNPSTPSQFQTCVNFSLPLYYHLIYRILRFVTWKGARNSHLQFHFSNIPSLLVKITLLTASNLLQLMGTEGTRARETAQLAEVVRPLDPCNFLLTRGNTGAVFRVRKTW